MNFDLAGGRRFVLTIVSGAGTWALCWFGKIDGSIYSAVTMATVAAYITGNVVQRGIEAKRDAEISSDKPAQ